MMSVTRNRMVILSGLKSKRCACPMSRGSYLESNGFDEFQKSGPDPGPPKKAKTKKKGVLEILGAPSGLVLL